MSRVIFMGTPEFACPSLVTLHKTSCSIVGVYTQPPRPSGRGLHLVSSPVAKLATSLGLPVFTPETLKTPEAEASLRSLDPTLIIVVAYGLLLPPAILAVPPLGAVNLHASLLPRWRGAAPIQRAVMADDRVTGISLMQMEEGLDTGPILAERRLTVWPRDTAGKVSRQLATLAATLLGETLPDIFAGRLHPVPQPSEGVTYAHKITKEERHIDWRQSAFMIERLTLALSPTPSAFCMIEGERVKIHAVSATRNDIDCNAVPGTVLNSREKDSILVACGETALTGPTALFLRHLQRPGRAILPASDFLRGMPLCPGMILS